MMGHPDDELLDRYVDGALTPEERVAVGAHLAGCERCRRELTAVQALFAAFKAVPIEPLPVDLAPRVVRRIAPEAQRQRRWLIVGVLVAQAGLTILLALWLVPPLGADRLPFLVWPGIDWSATGLRGWLPPSVAPLDFLAPLQWALVVAVMAVLWLVGNRLILARRIEGVR